MNMSNPTLSPFVTILRPIFLIGFIAYRATRNFGMTISGGRSPQFSSASNRRWRLDMSAGLMGAPVRFFRRLSEKLD